MPPSPSFNITVNPPLNRSEILSSQVVANIECNRSSQVVEQDNFLESGCGSKEEPGKDVKMYIENDFTSISSLQKTNSLQSDSNNSSSAQPNENKSIGGNSCEALELNIQVLLLLIIPKR